MLFEQYGDELAAYVKRRIPHREMAEDVIAQIWCKTIDNIPGHDHPEWFLFRVAKNAVIDWSRANKRVRMEPYDELAELTVTGPVHFWAEAQDPGVIVPPRLDLEQAIRSLPDRMQEAFILTMVDGLPCEVVAAMMGIGPETVRTHVARARVKLQVHESLNGYMPIR
ncbi:RNA polymerase sigma factor [Glycomyces sp. MUSA5-2]|uniref:RNA polymerase sigma factor n=1 Tax=Glycomyces sp. MUSA5-2 TaxID=2053002 RepID=UPI00300A555E